MRRGPHEHHREQHERRHRQRPGDRRPADQHRHRAGRAADHDVLIGRALQPHRVDEDVEGDRGQRQHRGEHVHRDGEEQIGAGGQHEPEPQRRVGLDAVAGQRALPGPLHDLVDIAIEVHVHRVGGARRERAADQRRQDQPDRRDRARGQEHRGHGDDQQQDDDARLRQRDVGAQRCRPSPAGVSPATGADSGASGAGVPEGCDARGHRQRHDGGPDQRREPDVRGTRPGRELGQARWRRRRAPAGPDQDQGRRREPNEQRASAGASSARGPCTTRTGRRRRSRAPGGRTSRRRRVVPGPARCCRPSAAIRGRRDPRPRPGRRCRRATSPYVAAAVQAVSRRYAGADPTPPAARVARGDRHRRSPSTRNATAKWIVTTPGFSWVAMIQPPIAACVTNSGSRITAMMAAGRSTSRRRSSDHAPAIPNARVKQPATKASSRCVYSINVWYSTRGIQEPKHCGQSGQPSPEPVARTTPPHAIRSRMATTVAVARARTVRFIGFGAP